MSERGRFITLEGSEGAGKSTNLEIVVDTLAGAGIEVVTTREPGGTAVAEAIRELLLASHAEPVDDLSELLLMFAARAQHVAHHIKPLLNAGTWIVCDRFTDATYAYQGGGRGIDPARIRTLESWVHGDLQPDLTLYLDVPTDIAFKRLDDRPLDRIEKEESAFFDRVRNTYLRRAAEESRIVVIDASVSLEAVGVEVRRAVHAFLGRQS